MNQKFNYRLLVLLLISSSITYSCVNVTEPIPAKNEKMFMSYTEQGGIAGANLKMTVDNNLLTLNDYYFNINHTLSPEELESLIDVFKNNNLAMFKSDISGIGVVVDGFTRNITYGLGDFYKSVTVHDNSDMPKTFYTIWEYLDIFGRNLIQNSTSGKIVSEYTYTLVEWPFPDEFSLSDHFPDYKYDPVSLPDNIITYLNENGTSRKIFFENEWIYNISFNDLKSSNPKVFIRNKFKPYNWENENLISIDNFGTDGYFIDGLTYENINNYIYGGNYRNLFIEGNIENGKILYRIKLFKGNGYENISSTR